MTPTQLLIEEWKKPKENTESVDERLQRMDKQLKKLEDAYESDTKLLMLYIPVIDCLMILNEFSEIWVHVMVDIYNCILGGVAPK